MMVCQEHEPIPPQALTGASESREESGQQAMQNIELMLVLFSALALMH